jgi:serine/threonine-protein kinase
MSPEQARGNPVDWRTDIWALGAVLWEMLTGRQLFAGDTVSDVMAAVLTREPDWGALPSTTPAAAVRLLRRALERDPRRRLQAIGEARLVLEDSGGGPSEDTTAHGASRRGSLIAAVVVASGVGLLAGWLLGSTSAPRDLPVRKVDLAIRGFEAQLGRTPMISPDGARVAYVADERLHVREIDGFESLELTDTAGVQFPSWAPDSRQLAYVRQGRAWKVSLDGGQSTELGTVPGELIGSGASLWTPDGRILIAGANEVGLWEIPAKGGEGREVLRIDPGNELDFHEFGLLRTPIPRRGAALPSVEQRRFLTGLGRERRDLLPGRRRSLSCLGRDARRFADRVQAHPPP